MNHIYVLNRHSSLLNLWREQGLRNLKVVHLDSHCDMRGLLVDRDKREAFRISLFHSVDAGNFLSHAIAQGIVRDITWVHQEWQGRMNDIGTVVYETDLAIFPFSLFRFLKRGPAIPLGFKPVNYSQWQGPEAGEHLDIDWDFFASFEKPRTQIGSVVKDFLQREFINIPRITYVCYSPDFSWPSLKEFNDFVKCLAEKFNAEVVTIERPFNKSSRDLLMMRRIFRTNLIKAKKSWLKLFVKPGKFE